MTEAGAKTKTTMYTYIVVVHKSNRQLKSTLDNRFTWYYLYYNNTKLTCNTNVSNQMKKNNWLDLTVSGHSVMFTT